MLKAAVYYSKLLYLLKDHTCYQEWTPSIVTLFKKILTELPSNVFAQFDFKQSQYHSKALIDLAQESILLYPYQNVPTYWRQLLMDASILQAISMIGLFYHGNKESKQRIARDMIQVLDTAMIISGAPGPERRETTHFILDQLQSYLSSVYNPQWLDDAQLPHAHTVDITYPIKRLEQVPSFVSFVEFLQHDEPFIIPQGAIDRWPARNKWSSLAYFVSVAGDRVVPVEIGSKYTDSTWQQKMMRIEDFLYDHVIVKKDEQEHQTAYLAQHDLFCQIPTLAKDVSIPDYCYCEPRLSKRYTEPPVNVIQNAWFGPQGTVSPLHHDPYHNVLAQVVGSKYLRLYAPSETEKLYPYDGIMSNTSQVDVENQDFDTFPLLKEAHYVECILQAGELLYIPVS
ncbi:hypothetical protein BDA99DRAFT_40854 [Phascolomyces articulosus]|uniref:JmjC domain-containing protein n=1 Tax=Phascolomyces articulosus TaxID=60185 RepID=A0AAD5PF44_9FUNG|nr:hypothetical protein BDA99DRAFT_40854 [Phascolomyces articulosus]